MASGPPALRLDDVLLLSEVRRFLRASRTIPLAVFVGVAYALASMLWGGMLTLAPIRGGTTVEILTGSGTGQGWWNYPGLLVVAPWGVLALPFFPTVAMVVVATGVALGMAVAIGLIVRLVRPTAEEVARSKAVGALTGLTPAMISLVTLGSCCTTTAAATGGIGLIAQASGTSTSNLLLNNWYLGVAQIAIVWTALLGQELLLTVYGGLLGLPSGSRGPPAVVAPPVDRRWAAGAALRAGLVAGGLLWSLSMVAEWTTHPPAASGAGWWAGWILQHQLLAGFAVGSAFYPAGAARLVHSVRTGRARLVGALLGGAALSVLVWLPPPLPAWGLDSLADQLLGVLGAPAAWGAIAPGSVTGVALVARWALEYVLPAGFALVAVLAPDRAFRPLLATVARPVGATAPTAGRAAVVPTGPSPGRPSTPDLAGGGAPRADLP